MQITALARVSFLLLPLLGAQAFLPPAARPPRADVSMLAGRKEWVKDASRAALTALPFLMPLVAGAVIDYEGVGYLGGGPKVDLNNANVRVYTKFQGMYPTLATKIASNGPYKSVADVYSIAGLTEQEKAVLKKNEGSFIVLPPVPEYFIDRVNNGLYR